MTTNHRGTESQRNQEILCVFVSLWFVSRFLAHPAKFLVRASADAGRLPLLTYIFRLGGTTRLRGNVDIYNVFNASNVLSMTTTYGPAWRDVAQVLSARLVRVGAQLDV